MPIDWNVFVCCLKRKKEMPINCRCIQSFISSDFLSDLFDITVLVNALLPIYQLSKISTNKKR